MSAAQTSLSNLQNIASQINTSAPQVIAEAQKPDGIDPAAVDAVTVSLTPTAVALAGAIPQVTPTPAPAA